MENWRVIGYIFLGWGSVLLIYALFVFLSMASLLSGVPFLNEAPIALAASAPYFVLAALLYVVGVVGYYAGRENVATPTTLTKADKRVSYKISSEWSLAVSALATLTILAYQYSSGIMVNPNRIYGFVLPMVISIGAGLILGLATYLVINKLD